MLRSGRSNSSNSLNEMDQPSAGQSFNQPIPQSTSQFSRPVQINRPMGRPMNQSQAMNPIAASAPTLSWVPPPAPSARPRLALIEPPPMELPPSPPVFSQMQMLQARNQVQNQLNNPMGIPMGGQATNQSSNQLQPQKYSRSLSSSAPAHHIDYLSQFRRFDQPVNQSSSQQPDEDMQPGGISINPAVNRTINQTLNPSMAELSKSPTIFSILTQHDQPMIQAINQPPNQPMSQSAYRRSSLVGQLIDEGDEEPEDDDHANNQAGPSADDLQFSINLDEEEEDHPSDLSLY